MSSLWSRLTQSLVGAGALNARQPLVAWEASWDEAEALQASGKLWQRTKDAEEEQQGSSKQPDVQQKAAQGVHLQTLQLTKRYGEREVLKQVQLDVRPGEFIAIVGRSGCGKSTLLRLVAGLEEASAGQLLIDAGDAREQRRQNRDTRIMFQDARLLPWKRVLDNVILGLPDSARERGRKVLAQVGLADRENEWPARLSGGQRQRVALARALVHQPRLLLLDEPLGALDALTRIEMHRLIEGLWRSHGFTALLVTHDVQEAVALADRVVLIEDGRIALDERIDLPRPRVHGDARFAALETRILDRVLQKPESEQATGLPSWPGVPATGLRWAI
ncbi:MULTISPECIES: ATP-binding cassette domain-containing protein [Comamonas]|uniref:ATP-binding cassette domain-containing protein n=1 Tax=Comamonas TaxID=283 RepID=UPI00057B193F|nr:MULTISPECIES: ATP-binding cassette domain-containing protein [Comamonas]MBL5979928.1 ATP-binding cassette domain-containing protein [Comamonas sp. NyZ500]QOQ80769.1 ATP-binding cassette domain-containing protein [Comamonas thiooxydans]UUE95770.1 ATP-binding cassette domain-containing protein [Comamonas thiooxydans]BDB70683.1 aliphatic sulfonates import ATP-binding protein SsuB 1 [Comamonas thiooxydans]